MCSPPGPDGRLAPAVLAAAAVAGVDEVYRVGGAQAIAALAYGTETVPAVDVIVGPGNRYVAIAERLVAGEGLVGVPSAFTGPSEVAVVADATTPVAYAAIDLVVQAEHGPDGLAYLITWSERAADAISAEVARLAAASPRRAEIVATLEQGGYAVLVDGPEQAMAVANAIAPEHLELMNDDPESLVPLVRSAGAVFLGPWAPASVGDYVAGPNHVLPTARSARFGSALRVDDFCKHIHVVERRPRGLARLAPHVVALAESEGLAAHADSVRIRSDPGERPDGAARAARGPRPARGIPLAAGRGGGAAQHQRVAAAAAARRGSRPSSRRSADRLATATPTASATDLRAALAELHGVRPEQVFCANGSNEVLQSLCLAYGGPGRSVAVFEPTYALHSHIAHLTGTAVAEGQRRPDFSLDLEVGGATCSTGTPGHHLPVLAQQPDRAGRRPARPCGPCSGAAPGLVVVDEAYGQFADWSALTLVDDAVPLVVTRTFSKTWSMAAARLGYLVGPGAGRGRPRAGGPPVSPRRLQAGGGPAGPPLRR